MKKDDLDKMDIRGLFTAMYKNKKPRMSEEQLWVIFKKQQDHRVRNIWLRKIEYFLQENESRENKEAKLKPVKESGIWD